MPAGARAVRGAAVSAPEIAAALAPYGARLTDEGFIARGDKVLGVRVEVRKGRLRMLSGENLLASFPARDVARGVAQFVERFLVLDSRERVNESTRGPSNRA